MLDVLCPLSIVPMKKRCSCRNPEGNLSFVHTWLVDTWKRTPHYKKQVDQSNRPLYWFLSLLSKAAENKFPLAVGVWKQGINKEISPLIARLLLQGSQHLANLQNKRLPKSTVKVSINVLNLLYSINFIYFHNVLFFTINQNNKRVLIFHQNVITCFSNFPMFKKNVPLGRKTYVAV